MRDLKSFVLKRAVICNIVLSVVAVVFFWVFYAINKDYMFATAKCLPYIFGFLLHLPVALCAVNIFFVRNSVFNVITIIFSVLSVLAYLILNLHILSVLFFVAVEIAPFIILALIVALIIYLFLSHKAGKKARVAVACVTLAVFALYAVFDLFNLKPNYINSDPVVFVVEDEYQICWSTSASATGVVRVGDEYYYDGANGIRNASTIHKVSVPREALDREGGYTVMSRAMIRRRTFVSTVGKTRSKSYAFKPVDESDGLKFYSFSDSHMQRVGVIRASGYFGDETDMIVANGDVFNNICSEYQVTLALRTLSKVSGSSKPVIMTRGNHETFGSIADRADEFLPSYNGKFYYTVRFDNTEFIVLDYASDHSDDDIISRPTHFDDYRTGELEWLENLKIGDGIKHVVALSHISFLRTASGTGNRTCMRFSELCRDLGAELMINGHSHRLELLKPGESYNNMPYVALIGSVRNNNSFDRDSASGYRFTGTAVEINDDGYTVRFTNAKREVLAEYVF